MALKDGEMAIENIKNEKMNIKEAKVIYDMSGRQITKVKRGLNILRMNDGTMKKVMVK